MFSSGSREKAVAEYYKLQATEYHHKYYSKDSESDILIKPEAELLQSTFRGLDVLEIACGTGFWTGIAANSANSVLGTDVNPSMIAEAKTRLFHLPNVSFSVSDAYDLQNVPEGFTGAFAVLFWCHIPRQRIREFLTLLHRKLAPGAPVVFIDQLEDSDSQTHCTDLCGNRIAQRRACGEEFSIIKNVPDKEQLFEHLNHFAENIQYKVYSGGYWSVSCVTREHCSIL